MVIMEKINKKFFIDTQQKYVPKIKQNIFGLSGVDEKMQSVDRLLSVLSKRIKECHKLSHVLKRVTNKPLFESLFA